MLKFLERHDQVFAYMRIKFPKLSEVKVKELILFGLEIWEFIHDREFNSIGSDTENVAWNAFKSLCTNFLGNHKADISREIVRKMLCVHPMKCNMSLKLHFLDFHLEFFLQNLGEISDENDERVHQDFSVMERRFVGRWNCDIPAETCCSIVREPYRVTGEEKCQEKHCNFVHV